MAFSRKRVRGVLTEMALRAAKKLEQKEGEELKIKPREWLTLSEEDRFRKIHQASTKSKGAQS
ncbi:hypothetical protein WV34_15335 [Bacillus amyloliquefaciens]|jgi:hypothetical protein|uniref:Uncharacterized protein n=1 Tax=Bacillus amyloliquefaciens (strain ATCC 23350 / DSM 7 / BCRC 11601 / CCUG 28519 / NBRC 15535 / NRRL B-14393 / F) TaxID=692420 RepID=A0A9P1NIS9_BACAS|nr:hypothetical protein BK055_16755 [Bacillus velezensis]ASF30048.1 hypothetical protein WV34_15335 [Bacillus amyloliquefaciens]OXL21180.1 hypothetical protein CFI04_08670 [Bacillus amyloliquefaciens]CBI44228.1 hypothetical protein predicted by Glimmer/Critica [Bacillus amyloliquefaciens DSM 7] [Bacillus amyloliquefaciens DSM 7 = ATCC 23350]